MGMTMMILMTLMIMLMLIMMFDLDVDDDEMTMVMKDQCLTRTLELPVVGLRNVATDLMPLPKRSREIESNIGRT
jgi:hypothetical protein